MEKTFKIFHYISFLQYPFLIIALYYCYKPIIFESEDFASDYNFGLLFLGIGLSFTSLADIKKRTKLGDRIFGKPKNAKRWIIYLSILIVIIFTLGIFTMFFTKHQELKDISVGLLVLGIGIIGLLRMNLEIIKTYQEDWKK
ncbi:hypothetical protein [Aquimarina mytili]|uniref:Uncharacterized protein n=1 Tax=Aquimarina mytili TaxID=874423 RepID=A0A936ZVC5_9FLAO|nr:hypothetical protein [Aquimarina mytili]MBL0684997.1 hypothetical protein [Aquimarina mytili]